MAALHGGRRPDIAPDKPMQNAFLRVSMGAARTSVSRTPCSRRSPRLFFPSPHGSLTACRGASPTLQWYAGSSTGQFKRWTTIVSARSRSTQFFPSGIRRTDQNRTWADLESDAAFGRMGLWPDVVHQGRVRCSAWRYDRACRRTILADERRSTIRHSPYT